MSDYGLDDVPGVVAQPKKPSPARLSLDDLPRPGGVKGGLNPFSDDAISIRSAEGLHPPNPSHTWPKRNESTDSSRSTLPAQKA